MLAIETTIFINRPVADVFSYVANLENWPQWEGNFKQVTLKTASPNVVGTLYNAVVNVTGKDISALVLITEFVANQKLAFKSDRPTNAKLMGDTLFAAEGTGTRITLHPRPEMGGIFRLLEPLMAGTIKSKSNANLQKLKAILEA